MGMSDLFPLKFENETKWILLVSINPGAPNGGSGTQYFIGEFNGVNFVQIHIHIPFGSTMVRIIMPVSPGIISRKRTVEEFKLPG